MKFNTYSVYIKYCLIFLATKILNNNISFSATLKYIHLKDWGGSQGKSLRIILLLLPLIDCVNNQGKSEFCYVSQLPFFKWHNISYKFLQSSSRSWGESRYLNALRYYFRPQFRKTYKYMFKSCCFNGLQAPILG